MILRSGLIQQLMVQDAVVGGDFIHTTSRRYDVYWLRDDDHARAFSGLLWTPIMLPVSGIDTLNPATDLSPVTFTGTCTFCLLDKDANVLFTIVSTFSAAVDIPDPLAPLETHKVISISNAFPDGQFYAGKVNGFSVDTVWTPANSIGNYTLGVGGMALRPIRCQPKTVFP